MLLHRVLVAVLTCLSCTLLAASPGLAGLRAPRGELRVVDTGPSQWGWITFNVFEHLIEIDRDGVPVPGLATSWRWIDDTTLEVKLRRDVRFHNGEVFDADVVKLNVEETQNLRHPFHLGNFLSFDEGTRLEILDPYTVRFAVTYDPSATMVLKFKDASVTDQHRSVRKTGTKR